MELADPGLASYLETVGSGPSAREVGVAGLRAASSERKRPAGPELPEVRDLKLSGGLGVRLYRPSTSPRPLLVLLHGGGWVAGDLETHDGLCRQLARSGDVAVLAVDYRRAPEHPWPAAVEDALTAFRWARGEAEVVGVVGDSAGGCLAALTCLRLRDAGEPQPAVQVLAYPNTDLTLAQRSIAEKATGWGLQSDDLDWFVSLWVPDPDLRAHPRVSPLREPDLSGLAPAVVVTAEHDPLRDEGNAYALGLRSAGVPVVHREERGQLHGFLGLGSVSPAAAEAAERLFADVRRALG